MAKVKTVELVGPGGRVVVNETDRETYIKKGYKPLEAVDPESEESEESDSESDDESRTVDDLYELFESHKIVDLKRFAKLANIKGGDQMNKAELVRVLTESGYKPDSGE